jgi:hypothetical protein
MTWKPDKLSGFQVILLLGTDNSKSGPFEGLKEK